ncbi:MAG: UUP1 family membrane protein, partial [Pseudolabrys sp.]
MRNLHVYLLAAALAAVGLGLAAYKTIVVGLPLIEKASVSAWEVESEVRVTANGGPLKVSMFVPEDSREYSVLDERVAAPDFGMTVAPEGANRRLNLTAREASGRKVARQRFLVHRNETRAPDRRRLPPFPQEVTLPATAQAVARTLYTAAH